MKFHITEAHISFRTTLLYLRGHIEKIYTYIEMFHEFIGLINPLQYSTLYTVNMTYNLKNQKSYRSLYVSVFV